MLTAIYNYKQNEMTKRYFFIIEKSGKLYFKGKQLAYSLLLLA